MPRWMIIAIVFSSTTAFVGCVADAIEEEPPADEEAEAQAPRRRRPAYDPPDRGAPRDTEDMGSR
jgi:hypothetical protein